MVLQLFLVISASSSLCSGTNINPSYLIKAQIELTSGLVRGIVRVPSSISIIASIFTFMGTSRI